MGDMRQLSTTGRSPSCVIEAREVPLSTNGTGIQEGQGPAAEHARRTSENALLPMSGGGDCRQCADMHWCDRMPRKTAIVTIDSREPRALAEYYCQVLGMSIDEEGFGPWLNMPGSSSA
jgi:hypothetical protein